MQGITFSGSQENRNRNLILMYEAIPTASRSLFSLSFINRLGYRLSQSYRLPKHKIYQHSPSGWTFAVLTVNLKPPNTYVNALVRICLDSSIGSAQCQIHAPAKSYQAPHKCSPFHRHKGKTDQADRGP